jgi:hypothetical protein
MGKNKNESKYQDFFGFMADEHNLLLTITEIEEIIREVKKIDVKTYVECVRTSFPQFLKQGKKYELLAKTEQHFAIIDETRCLAVWNECYFK